MRFITSIVLIVAASACVDRIYVDIVGGRVYSVSIYGYISDKPGPYQIQVNKSYDIESKLSTRIPVSVKSMVLSDDQGVQEELSEVEEGVYQTSINGIRGAIGRAYKIRIELFDGRVYESIPDTLFTGGKVDSLYYNFIEENTMTGASQYGFDIMTNSSSGNSNHHRFLWQFTGTFKADTHPEYNHKVCEYYNGKCNYAPLCSGLINVGGPTLATAIWERVKPCECCTCWYSIYNNTPILSDNLFNQTGIYYGIKVQNVPLNPWIFKYKLHVEVNQLSLSSAAFQFWRAIKDQKEAIGSLFQPVTGIVPTNFVQVSGENTPIIGLFYSVSISSRSFFITPNDVPRAGLSVINPTIPPQWNDSCLTLFPNATTTKPSFWID